MYLGQYPVKNNNKFTLPKKLRQGDDSFKLVVEDRPENEEVASLIPERFFEKFAGATAIKAVFDIKINKKHEIKLPNDQLFDQLGKIILLVGLGNFIEIWNKEVWEKYQEEELTPEKINQVMEELEKKNPNITL